MPTSAKSYRADATVRMANVARHIEAIVESIATHDMTVNRRGDSFHISSSLGEATLCACADGLKLTVEAHEPGGLNRLKHALVGPIGFIAAIESPDISWTGAETQPTMPDDLRVLTVAAIEQVTPLLLRLTFSGDDLARYDRRDQLHCRLIFPRHGERQPQWPMLDGAGHVIWPEHKIPTRVYTIRDIDAAAQRMVIDFALHPRSGPATDWARTAGIGDIVGVLGPAANGIGDAKFYVFAGDETGLPGIARLLAALPPTARGIAFIEVANEQERQHLPCPAGIQLNWLSRDDAEAGTTDLLEQAVRKIEWPSEIRKSYFWGGCEHKAFSAIHRHLRHTVGLPRDRMTFYSHWNRGLSEEAIIEKGAEAYLPSET